ncbi:MAG TPA: hypothetical protein VF212_11835 [Longimicrobiales bacterium]
MGNGSNSGFRNLVRRSGNLVRRFGVVRRAGNDARTGSLIRWLMEQGLLRGPYLFIDYWANVLGLGGIVAERNVRDGLVDPALFRLGIDRPELEIPRLRHALSLFLGGPLLLPFRSFRRLGRYRLRFRRAVGEEARVALDRHRLVLEPAGPGRVHVSANGATLARDVLDPFHVSGFCSLFWAAYKLPFVTLTAIVLVAVVTPGLYATGHLDAILDYWVPVGVPVLAVFLYLAYRDWTTVLLGTLPLLLGRYLIAVFEPGAERWTPFFWALAGLFTLFLAIDTLFLPRPVPPVLLLYTADGPGRPYAREEDAPYWLEGRCYWVWRYLILSPAELNKFWERDWERVDLWIRGDGPDAGMLEWVVTDMHYREIWVPYDRLEAPATLKRQRELVRRAAAEGRPGLWLLEVDTDLVVHYPFFRTVSFVPETGGGGVPARSLRHVITSLWKRAREADVEPYLRALDRVRLRRGRDILGDLPEVVAGRAARHLMAQPWTYWRYPLGAATPEEARLYGTERPVRPPAAADPELQVKAGDGSA